MTITGIPAVGRSHTTIRPTAKNAGLVIQLPPHLQARMSGPQMLCLVSGWMRDFSQEPHELFRIFSKTEFKRILTAIEAEYNKGKWDWRAQDKLMRMIWGWSFEILPKNWEIVLDKNVLSAIKKLNLADLSPQNRPDLVLVEAEDHIQLWLASEWEKVKSTAPQSAPR